MAFDIQLYPPYVTIVLADSTMDLKLPEGSEFNFGSVYQINLNTTQTSQGKLVVFNKTRALLVTQGSASYFITDERELLFQERPDE